MSKNNSVKIKCIFIIPSMGNGGAERVLATLANELSKTRYDILIVTLTSGESFYELDADVKIVGAGYQVANKNKIVRNINMIKHGIGSLLYINRILKTWEPDIVISFLTHTNILSIIIKLFNSKVKLIVSERCEPNVRNLFTRISTKYLYPLADSIICQSKMVSNFFPEYAQKKVRVIQNPVNIEAISTVEYNQRRKVIVGVGRLFEQKNFSLLIDSFNNIVDDFPEHTLEIYGEGPLRDQLQYKIDNLGLTNRIFLKGIKKNVMKHISDAELFVMSSNFEGFPNALVEAMASGIPVISTNFSTGVALDLVKKENGIVVPVGDSLSMSQAMKEILSNKHYQSDMSRENRKIKNKLSTERILSKWVDVIEEII